jgi:hypothetical protein
MGVEYVVTHMACDLVFESWSRFRTSGWVEAVFVPRTDTRGHYEGIPRVLSDFHLSPMSSI